MKSPSLLPFVVAAIAFLSPTQANSDEPDKSPTPAADTMRGRVPGEIRDDNGLKMKLVWCPPGSLTMENVEVIEAPAAKNPDKPPDDDDEVDPKDDRAPRQSTRIIPVKVFLTQGYWLGRFEVTQSQWKEIMKTEPWKNQDFTKEGADYPATFVSWNDANDFCRNLTEQERRAGRLPKDWEYTLPTEAQWVRACRARTDTKFSFGNAESKLGDYAWFQEDALNAGEQYAHQVGQKKGNPWGLFDMHGNVWEWYRDVYTQTLPGGRDPEVKADEKTKGSRRVYGGGSWSSVAADCQSGIRYWNQSGFRNRDLGFRPALCSVR
jgi:formylglycine-generating enzyme required for sulfatase activity